MSTTTPKTAADMEDQPAAAIVNGVPWFDDRGQPVNAHGGCLVEEDGRYYLFGEYMTDEENKFIGFACYSSPNLTAWRFERLVLASQPAGLLGHDRIGERVKVMKCPATGRFVMLMHTDNLSYTDAWIGLATCETIAGNYAFHGALCDVDDTPVQGWDMGTFQDTDGTGYLILHEGDIFQLSQDYTRVETQVAHDIAPGGESPAMFRHDGTYFLLFSSKTSWERNDNYYLSAPTVAGPWTAPSELAPTGTLTHNSQCTFVFPVTTAAGTAPLYMGDRWSYPHQASAATYVWLPLTVEGTKLSLPEYWPAWNPATLALVTLEQHGTLHPIKFSSEITGATVSIPLYADRVALHGHSCRECGYARIEILDTSGALLTSSTVDFYSKAPDNGWRFLSPPLPSPAGEIRVTVTGELPVWFNKAGDRYGSTGTRVSIDGVLALT